MLRRISGWPSEMRETLREMLREREMENNGNS
jgi:hypothetical protein